MKILFFKLSVVLGLVLFAMLPMANATGGGIGGDDPIGPGLTIKDKTPTSELCTSGVWEVACTKVKMHVSCTPKPCPAL